ncbi:MAG: MFS transporter [Candidatus Cryptobacteroides sp.]|nr:MFS transporter [Bacteroidales bacterium]MDY5496315.1 MFS transporter [Candidatus Cryptobacteroides sp.]
MNKRKTAASVSCWAALACLVVPMFASYFFDDMFSSLSQLFRNPELLELGWDSADYGFYAGGYSFLCVWGGLIVCGMLLDKWGVRVTGSIFVGMMTAGAALVTFAITSGMAPKTSLTVAYAGCMLFGLGSEIAGVGVTRSIAKWFKGRNMAFAMGLQLAIARLGTALALILSPMLVKAKAEGEIYTLLETAKPAFFGLALLLLGTVLWAVFVMMDARFDAQNGLTDRKERKEEDEFKFSDIFKVLSNKHFIMSALLCVFFYCSIISFKKFATSILIPRFDLPAESASLMVSLIPFSTVIFAPLFGSLVDKVGKGTRWMIAGSVLVFIAHIIIAFAPEGVSGFGYAGIAILGVGYSIVPAALWPTVSKIVPEKNLGTAYSLIYWIQNMGMLLVPVAVGFIFRNTESGKLAALHSEYVFLALCVLAIAVSLLYARSSDRNPDLGLDRANS